MKITLAQINTTVGDLVGNTNKIIDIFEKYKNETNLIVFPELTITSYPPLDLIGRPEFLDDQNIQLQKIIDATKFSQIGLVIGYFQKNKTLIGKPLYNSLGLIQNGKIQFVYNKHLLPTYDVFDEYRWFEPGVGNGVYNFEGLNIGFGICEDFWNDKSKPLYNDFPIEGLDQNGADLIISINASPSHIGKPEYRLEKFSNMAKIYNKPIIYVNQVGGQDDLVFDGSSFAIDENGIVVEELKRFEEDVTTINIHVPLPISEYVASGGGVPEPCTIYSNYNLKSQTEKTNLVIQNDPKSWFFYQSILLGLRDYMTKCGFKKAVVASSGGIDSALVLALAVEALGSECVEAITMPSSISSSGSWIDSEDLCKNLGIKLYNYPISNSFTSILKTIDYFGNSKSLTKENLQARIRGIMLMAFSNQNGNLALGTGNKSELSTGFCTLGGDMLNCFNPIGDLYKTECWALAKFINNVKGKEIIPNQIIIKKPSAELYENQLDTDSLPPYEVLDAILIQYIEGNEVDPEIIKNCKQTIEQSGFKDIAKIHKMVDNAEFKRRMSCPILKLHQKAFGTGRRLPIAQKYTHTF